MKTDPRHLIAVLEESGYEPESYSGRCMYGRRCVGVVVGRDVSFFKLGLDVALSATCVFDAQSEEGDYEDFLESLAQESTSEDSMGLDKIIYWPSVPWTETSGEDAEEEEEPSDEPGQARADEP